MDPRRHLILRRAARWLGLAGLGLALSGCGALRAWVSPPPQTPLAPAIRPVMAAAMAPTASPDPPLGTKPVAGAPGSVAARPAAPPSAPRMATMAPIPNPPEPAGGRQGPSPTVPRRDPVGRAAIAVANREARIVSRPDTFTGGVQIFHYDAGQLFEVWTAPLRVTTLTLAPGETVVSKAAGDTIRWQIGETTSGDGAGQRTHVMIKPLERGLETNLVIATNQRLYQLILRSAGADSFNAIVTWDLGAASADARPAPPAAAAPTASVPARLEEPHATTAGLDARYRIAARGKTPAWAPTAVMTDGARTFLAFPPTLAHGETPALFATGANGDVQLLNYRQQGGLWVIDRVVERGELRLGDRPRDVVHFVHVGAPS